MVHRRRYDGRCFCDSRSCFPDRTAGAKLSNVRGGVVDAYRFKALSGTLSFSAVKHKYVAVKVIDPDATRSCRFIDWDRLRCMAH